MPDPFRRLLHSWGRSLRTTHERRRQNGRAFGSTNYAVLRVFSGPATDITCFCSPLGAPAIGDGQFAAADRLSPDFSFRLRVFQEFLRRVAPWREALLIEPLLHGLVVQCGEHGAIDLVQHRRGVPCGAARPHQSVRRQIAGRKHLRKHELIDREIVGGAEKQHVPIRSRLGRRLCSNGASPPVRLSSAALHLQDSIAVEINLPAGTNSCECPPVSRSYAR
jgi:hypothetical protein